MKKHVKNTIFDFLFLSTDLLSSVGQTLENDGIAVIRHTVRKGVVLTFGCHFVSGSFEIIRDGDPWKSNPVRYTMDDDRAMRLICPRCSRSVKGVWMSADMQIGCRECMKVKPENPLTSLVRQRDKVVEKMRNPWVTDTEYRRLEARLARLETAIEGRRAE